jgi:hypothetical protein
MMWACPSRLVSTTASIAALAVVQLYFIISPRLARRRKAED